MKLVSRRAASQDYYEATFPLLAATLFSHLAFEAFLNDRGSRLRPDIWTKERTFFSQGDFRNATAVVSSSQAPSSSPCITSISETSKVRQRSYADNRLRTKRGEII